MKVFVSSLNIPIGYTTPRFPALYWPLGATQSEYQQLFLYYSIDIWKFTVYWSLILFGAIYLLVGCIAALNISMNPYRFSQYGKDKPKPDKSNEYNEKTKQLLPYSKLGILNSLLVVVIYVLSGSIQGFVSGAVVGVMLLAIYKAGSLPMSCWIPLSWGIALILFNICNSYRTSSLIL